MTRPGLVILDCDGVLVDSEPITNRLLREDFARRGLALTEAQVIDLFVGGTMKGAGEEAARLGADIPEGWVDHFYEVMHAALDQGTPIIEGVAEVLDRLDAAGVPYCVGSNGSTAKMRITLGQHPRLWDRLKDRLYSSHTYGVAKPNPDLFLIAARDHGVAAEACTVVDDSPTGCIAARRAGMRCFGYAAHDDGAKLAAENAIPFHHMRDLPRLLGL